MEKIAILLKVRSKADEYKELWKKRKEMIEKDPDASIMWDNFPEYPNSTDSDVKKFCGTASAQLALYRAKKGAL